MKQHPDFKVCMRAVLMKHLHTQVLIIQQLLLLIMHSLAQLSLLEDAMEELRKFEGELKVKSSLLSSLRIDVSSAESLSKLKGKWSHC